MLEKEKGILWYKGQGGKLGGWGGGWGRRGTVSDQAGVTRVGRGAPGQVSWIWLQTCRAGAPGNQSSSPARKTLRSDAAVNRKRMEQTSLRNRDGS